jgi:outer membrane protein OmpA-like peptidoglycan-associated protein
MPPHNNILHAKVFSSQLRAFIQLHTPQHTNMKSFRAILLTFAAAAFATGCTPQYPPSGYEDGASGPKTGEADWKPGQGTDGGAGVTTASGLPGRNEITARNASGLYDPTNGGWNPAAVLTTIFFEFGSYTVSSAERAKLTAIADQGKSIRIISAGYTDHFGTEQYNRGLSDKRAQNVKSYLVGIGIAESKIDIVSFGKQFARPTGTRAEVSDDRRVVVVNADYGK